MVNRNASIFENRPSTTAGTPSVLPRPDFHFPGEVGRTYLDSDPAQFPKPVQAPKGAPNILLILIDDCGFGQYETFGGGIPSPTMDRLAAEGLRYNCFHIPRHLQASPNWRPGTTAIPAYYREAAVLWARSCDKTDT